MEEAFLSGLFFVWQPQPKDESGILCRFCLYDSPACKVCFAGRISYNNLYTGRISLYKRIRRGCCSGYFRPVLVQKSSRVQIPWVHFFLANWLQMTLSELIFSFLVQKSSKEKFKNWLQQSIFELFELLSSFFFWVLMHLNSNGKWVQKFKEFTFFFTSGVFVD